MANIANFYLHPVGYDLFSDSELFTNDLIEEELNIQGGIIVQPWFSPYCPVIPTRLTYPPTWRLTVLVEKRG